MKEKVLAYVSTFTGPATTAISIENIDDMIKQTTPLLTWIGLVIGVILSFFMAVYWGRRAFKKRIK